MTPESAAGKVQERGRVVAVLALVIVFLAVSNAILGVVVFRKQPTVVLVPTLTGEGGVREGRPTAEYLEMLTRDVAWLFLNRHPYNKSYFEESLLRIVDAEVFSEISQQLKAQREERFRTNTSTAFDPIDIFVDPAMGYGEITGILRTFVGRELVSETTRTYAARFATRGVATRLLDFSEIDISQAKGRKIPVEEQE